MACTIRMLALALVVGCAALQPPWVTGQSAPPNLTALKGQMKVFDAVVDQTMSQTFTAPFGLLEKTQGAYLPNFGVIFSLEVNLSATRLPSLFDPRPLTQAEIDRAQHVDRERITLLRQTIPRLLADHATGLHDLDATAYLAVVVHLFQIETAAELTVPSQLVIEARKSDLAQFWDKKISYQQLVARIKILQM